jgi:hypothetical protein
MKTVERFRQWWRVDELEGAREASLVHDVRERDRLEEDEQGIKADIFDMSGNGFIFPTMPLGPAGDIEEVFQRDTETPRDETP